MADGSIVMVGGTRVPGGKLCPETVTIAVLAGIALVLAGVALTRGRSRHPRSDEIGPAGPSK